MTCNRSGFHIKAIAIVLFLTTILLVACQPPEPEMIVVTEVIPLGEEQIIITRLVELQPTATPTTPPPEQEPEPVALDIAYDSVLPDLDPQHVSGKASLDLAESLFSGLTNFNHYTQAAEPELAESWRISGDGRIWTFSLRDDIYWFRPLTPQVESDSTTAPELLRRVDAHDVAFAFRRACSQENNVTDAFLLFIVEGCESLYPLLEPSAAELGQLGIEALDDKTVQFTLIEPASDFLTITSLPQFRPVPYELVEEHGDEWRNAIGELSNGWQTPENLVVSGPFIPSSNTFNDSDLVLFRNTLWPLKSEGNVDLINIQFQMDEMDMIDAWDKRELDLSRLPPERRENFLDTSPDKVRLITNQDVFYVGFNFDSPVFQEPNVRRAFSAAIDRTSLTESMFNGRAQELRHFTPPGVFGSTPADEVGVGFSPDYALQQMDQSSIRSCKLLPPVIMVVSTADLSLLQAELLRDMWVKELGCDDQLIQVEQVEFGTLLAQTSASAAGPRADMWELAWPAYYPDAHNYLGDLLHCTAGENRQNRPCSEEDRLLRQARIVPDPQERISLYRQVENGFFSENGSFPVIPLYVRGDYILVQSWLDFPPALSGGEQFDTYRVDQELKRLERSRD